VTAPTAFYTVTDERYFLGAVGLVNSLRMVGHDEPIVLLDCGLRESQRALLEPHAELVPAPAEAPPWLLKTRAPLARPAQAMVLLDADIVVTRSLAPLVERARGGRLVAFRNPEDRFVAEWGELLELGAMRRGPYLGSGAIFAERPIATEVLELMEDRQRLIDFELSYWRRDDPGYAFRYGDQDVFNAVLASRLPAERVVALDSRLAPTPPFRGLRVADECSLRCVDHDGEEPYLVHHHVAKPWLEPTHHGVYSRLLRRLLVGEDVAIRVPEEQIPLRLRSGLRAYAERKRINAAQRFRWHVREPLWGRSGGR
jgi:hypothetical protein